MRPPIRGTSPRRDALRPERGGADPETDPETDSDNGGHAHAVTQTQATTTDQAAANEKLVLALPKGRILDELAPMLDHAGIEPEAAFSDDDSRQLRFTTNHPELDIIRVRSFDVATFVAFGAAHLGVAGNDVIMEFDYPELYAPVDLGIGHCRMAVAQPRELVKDDDPARWSHVRIATKYPNITKQHFAARGVQAETVKLNGAMELAPSLGLCRRIVDLVSSGKTLKANDLVEVEHIANVTSRLIANRAALKTRPHALGDWIERFREAADAA
ncbi:ATP phosphoribosyltransferase (homohexameric) [Limimonas halophila]|uniref:ATP phosphoribosyltransferase n=1 Tax=Limimonas halophila TaxID=1082479 RepID=A0A1G7QLK2_9PROT|nr:ATP phosphoribosyltransferase [Limimonas halophila]SDF99362.1 ATP phosphoribosyltransferase (homohexameric) [Limimonas halophila]